MAEASESVFSGLDCTAALLNLAPCYQVKSACPLPIEPGGQNLRLSGAPRVLYIPLDYLLIVSPLLPSPFCFAVVVLP